MNGVRHKDAAAQEENGREGEWEKGRKTKDKSTKTKGVERLKRLKS